MLKKIVLFTGILFPFIAGALEVNAISVETEQNISAGTPIQVSILVTHDSESKIEEGSFKMEEKALDPVYVKQIKMSENSELVISIYQMTLPAQKPGAYSIPPISVIIGDKTYTSYEDFYNVQ